MIALPHVPQKGGAYAKLEVCIYLRRIHPRTACDTDKIIIHLLPECQNEEPQQKETFIQECYTAILIEAWATLPESSSWPLPATMAQTRNLAHASLETAVLLISGVLVSGVMVTLTRG